ncbi:MAG TPA: CusA/CzcA family heavy metal efflux RND transporter [Acidobacteriaceae bacterium]|jgi:Cu(I)/Ag(I) efflux system membrane protein CusA/SilA|nr:CusA/CzcA family heavy metal efflux RND transporter [Acidobacteriaceae bacterium]
MIERILDFSVRHKAVVLTIVALLCIAGCWSMSTLRLDAVPDLGDTQVIVYSRWDQSPDLVEQQVTYPIVTAMLGAPHVKAVRGISDYGYSYVYVIFDDDTDLYWARSRTLEYLSAVLPRLPDGVRTEIGPDATSLGWVYQYAFVDTTHQHSLAEMRSYQDWYLRYYLKAVPGVADVAPVGGFTREYQVSVDPGRLQAYGVSMSQVVDAVRQGNAESSARLLDFGGTEYMVRGRGYATSLEDFRNIVVATGSDGNPIRVGNLGQVATGPDLRRGLADLDGQGEVVSGIVIMRSGENALDVTNRVRAKLHEIQPALPPGIAIVPVYDRSELIHRTIGSVRETIFEIVITVTLIVLIFLWHFPSAAIPLVTMPAAVLLSFIPFRLLGMSANLMSLAGVAIAFGELIDASVVIAEQTHKRLEQWEKAGRPGPQTRVVLSAVKEVAGPTFFALLVIAVSFLPILALDAQEGRLFRPLVYTKSLAMVVAAVLVLTLDPALRLLLAGVRRFDFEPAWICRMTNALLIGKIRSEENHPISRTLTHLYEPVVRWTLRHKAIVLGTAVALIGVTIPVFLTLGSEFMPPMDEGAILYMPTSMPGISIAEAQRVLQSTDAILHRFPEVDRVLGKAGRAETPTDPAPLSMLETVIILRPRSQWRHVPTWYSSWSPEWAKSILRHITPDTISAQELTSEMNAALQVPGFSSSWTAPIKGRVDMLNTGMRTPLGLKISGSDFQTIQQLGERVEAVLRTIPGTRSAYAERTSTGYFLDVNWNRDELARYGISIARAQEILATSVGGETISSVLSGPERYPVNVRYMRDFRSSLDALGRVLVPGAGRQQIPLRQLAAIQVVSGPSMIRDENGLLTGYVYVDVGDRDIGSYVAQADPLLRRAVAVPPGNMIAWSGQYEAMMRVRHRLWAVVPVTVAIVLLLLFANTRSFAKTTMIVLAVPFSAVGAVWLLFLLHYNMSVAVWVGLIALLSIDAETGVFMLLYLDLALRESLARGSLHSIDDLRNTIVYGAAKRLRPKFMTFAIMFIGLLPVMWSVGTGADVMKRIAAPMLGGIFSSFFLELLVYPPLYELWKRKSIGKKADWDLQEPLAGDRSGEFSYSGD